MANTENQLPVELTIYKLMIKYLALMQNVFDSHCVKTRHLPITL